MKILITGSKGMLASALASHLKTDNEITPADKNLLDISDFSQAEDFLNGKNFDLIINCAAYTDVDMAETEKDTAMNINFCAVKNLAILSENHNIKLIHISTDYVFDGHKTTPYTSSDKTNPINFYGYSKLQGEIAAQKYAKKSYIVRTSWLYGNSEKCFINKIIKKIQQNEKTLNIVNDKIGSPTSVTEFSKHVLDVLKKDYGVYHLVSKGGTSWFEFAKRAAEIIKSETKINPVKSEELNLKAKRPVYSVLKSDFLTQDWQDDLKNYLKNRK